MFSYKLYSFIFSRPAPPRPNQRFVRFSVFRFYTSLWSSYHKSSQLIVSQTHNHLVSQFRSCFSPQWYPFVDLYVVPRPEYAALPSSKYGCVHACLAEIRPAGS